jgi:hypothetical protein
MLTSRNRSRNAFIFLAVASLIASSATWLFEALRLGFGHAFGYAPTILGAIGIGTFNAIFASFVAYLAFAPWHALAED